MTSRKNDNWYSGSQSHSEYQHDTSANQPHDKERDTDMPLGKIDFQNIPTFEPVEAGVYDGFTESWESKPTKAGDSTNIEGKFKYSFVDAEGVERDRSIVARWNLKKEALWRLRNDLVNMGVDPSELNSDSVDLEAILNNIFGVIPTPVTLNIIQRTWTPDGGEPQQRNEVAAVKLRSA